MLCSPCPVCAPGSYGAANLALAPLGKVVQRSNNKWKMFHPIVEKAGALWHREGRRRMVPLTCRVERVESGGYKSTEVKWGDCAVMWKW